MSERPRIFADWRFLAMLAFLLMVGYLVLTGVTAIQRTGELDRQNAAKSSQIDSLIKSGRQANADATRERQALLAAQQRLLIRLDTYDARQRALLAYLRKHGIEIPTRFVEVPVTQTPAGGGRPGSPPQSPPSGSQPNPPPVGPPAPSSGPGKSDGHADPHATPGPKPRAIKAEKARGKR